MNNIGLDQVKTNSNLNFKSLLNNDEENSTPYENIGHFCEYYEQDEFTNKVKKISNKFSTYLHNVRSLTPVSGHNSVNQ